MDLQHEFIVPTGVQQAWDHFQDIASVATCFPGAQVTSVEQDSFSGQVKVKLGPIAMVYTGKGHFVDRDEAAHSFVVEAKGRDKRGNGTAGATVTLTMAEQGPDSTAVTVVTDLAVTGKPAQFGRGVMQDVSDQLLGQFTACLERRLSSGEDAPASPTGSTSDPLSGKPPAVSSESTPLAAAAAASSSAGESGLLAAAGAAPVSAGSSSQGSGSAPSNSPLLAAASAPSVSAAGPEKASANASTSTSRPNSASSGAAAQNEVEALDLGSTVLPILIKGYWKQALVATLAAVVGFVVLRRLLGGSEDED